MKVRDSSICLFLPGIFFLCAQADSAQNAAPAAKSKALTNGRSAYVSGTIFDGKFDLDKAFYSPQSLILRSRGTASGSLVSQEGCTGIKITFAANQQFEGKSYQVAANQDKMVDGAETKPIPVLRLYAMVGGGKDPYLDNFKNHAPYRMTLNFYKRQKGLLPGFIDLEIQDPHLTKIRGYFWAAPQS